MGAAFVKGALADACASSATSNSLDLVKFLISKVGATKGDRKTGIEIE
jgi:hypothetical protein